MSMDNKISRQEFLKSAGKSIAGVALLGGMGTLLTACSEQSTTPATNPTPTTPDAPQWPFAYVRLDPEEVAARAYSSYKTGGG